MPNQPNRDGIEDISELLLEMILIVEIVQGWNEKNESACRLPA